MNKKLIALIKLALLCVAVLILVNIAPEVYQLLFDEEITPYIEKLVVVISLTLLALGAGYYGKNLK